MARPRLKPALRAAPLAARRMLGALALLAGAASAHDSWLVPLPPTDRGEAVLALGTGHRFPAHETAIPLPQLARTGCRSPGLRPTPLRWVADRPEALVLRASRPVPATVAQSCWVQLHPIPIQIDDATAELYLKEVNASPALRERWSALRARGVRWQETYTKHARIELPAAEASDRREPTDASGLAADAAHQPSPDALGLDLRIDSARPLRAGDLLRAQLLRDGQPLAGLAVELRSELSPLGLWRVTDTEGRLQLPVPFAGAWLLRAIDLRPAPDDADRWDSRFVTLAFQVLPAR